MKKTFVRSMLLGLALVGASAHSADYVPAHCAAVAGTLNIFWEEVAGAGSPCTGIEFTNGTLADAADGNITMSGVSVSNPSCIGTAAYAFTQSSDRKSLVGADTANNVPMTLTLSPDGACYVGHWVSGSFDFVATLNAAPFPQPIVATPTLGLRQLSLFAGLLALLGCLAGSGTFSERAWLRRLLKRAR
ncbi:MAG: hypothetical protein ACYC7G_03205 [Rudaea sp.]